MVCKRGCRSSKAVGVPRSWISIDSALIQGIVQLLPSVIFWLSSPSMWDQADSPLRLGNCEISFLSQFITTPIFESSEILKFTLLKHQKSYSKWLEEILKFAILKWLKIHLKTSTWAEDKFEIYFSQMHENKYKTPLKSHCSISFVYWYKLGGPA